MRALTGIGFFAILTLAAMLPAPAAGPDAVDLKVCALLSVDHAGRRIDDYVVSAAILDIDGDGTPEWLTIGDTGTAHNGELLVARVDGSAVDLGEAEANAVSAKDDDWRGMPGRRWLIYAGRAYGLRFAGWGTGYLHYVSRIGPDFVERPLCKLEPQPVILPFSPQREADNDVCKAVAEGRVAYVTPRRADPRPVPGREIIGGATSLAGEAMVDFDNTGRKRPLGLYTADSVAGPGCQLAYYDTAPDDDPGSLAHAQLTAMQGLNLEDAYPRRTCDDAEPRWFTFGGVTYLQTQSDTADAPASERGEYQYVDVIQRGLPRRVCQTRYAHDPPKIVGVWDGADWAAPPPSLLQKPK